MNGNNQGNRGRIMEDKFIFPQKILNATLKYIMNVDILTGDKLSLINIYWLICASIRRRVDGGKGSREVGEGGLCAPLGTLRETAGTS